MKQLIIIMVYLIASLLAKAQIVNSRIDSLFQSLNQDGELSGSFIVIDSGHIVFEKNYGFEDSERKNKISSLSRFELASVSKQFTAMAIMQLEEKGKLSYEDEIIKYFPNLKFKNIKIKHLLRNTSGIPEFLAWDSNWIDKTKINNNQDLLTLLQTKVDTLNFNPGDQYSYSNTNYVLLALIVEKVSGIGFQDYMSKYVFKPAGMKNTSVFSARSPKADLTNYAKGYAYNAKHQTFESVDIPNTYHYVKYFDGIYGPYGISSTATDLVKWIQALDNYTLLKKENFNKAISVDTLNNGKPIIHGSGLNYGFGWIFLDDSDNSNKMHFHTGGYPGYQTIIVRDPSKKTHFIALLNKWNTVNVFPLTGAVSAILENKDVPKINREILSEAITLVEFQIKQLLGTYAYDKAPELEFEITADEDGNILAKLTGQLAIQVYPKSELELFYTAVKADLKFNKDANQITALTLFQNGQELTFKKIK